MMLRRLLILGMIFVGWANAAAAENDAMQTPADQVVNKVSLQQRIGEQLPLELPFRDTSGRRVRLSEYFNGQAVLLVPIWYSCPNLCGVTLRGLEQSLREIDFSVGKDFQVVAISVDPKDPLIKAAGIRSALLENYGRPESADGWHLLTGDQEAIEQVYEAMGVGYVYDAALEQYAHPATLLLATPSGQISRYLPGVVFEPRTVRLGLLEAARGQLGSVVDKVLLRCYSYDPATGRYSLLVIDLLRIAGSATVILLGGGVLLAIRRERRSNKKGTRQ